jgi:osmotically-inducible protein OsmY/sporulation protein YlmC with PRC-barrel domain
MTRGVRRILALAQIEGATDRLERILAELARHHVDAIAVVGDLSRPGGSRSEGYRAVFRALGMARVPAYWVPGPEDAPIGEHLRESYNLEIVYPFLHGVHGTVALAPGYVLFAGMGGEIVDDPDAPREERARVRYPRWEAEYRLKLLRELGDYEMVLLFSTVPARRPAGTGSTVVDLLIKTYSPRVVVVPGPRGRRTVRRGLPQHAGGRARERRRADHLTVAPSRRPGGGDRGPREPDRGTRALLGPERSTTTMDIASQVPLPRFEIRPGAAVLASDGPAGDVLQVVVSPRERRVTGLVVRTPGGREALIPVDRVVDATDSFVRLSLTCAGLEALAPWSRDRYVPAALSWPGWRRLLHGGALLALPARLRTHEGLRRQIGAQAEARPGEREATIRRGQRVLCADGSIGRVDLVLVDAGSGRVRHLVVRRGRLFSRDVAVPADWVRSITPEAVVLEASCDAVAQLPIYRPDDELQRDVEDALGREELLRVLDVPIQADVEDGMVRLRGHVPTRALAARVEEIVRGVPGVAGVENALAVDLEVLQDVTAALQRDPRTRRLVGHQVRIREGIVELEGPIGSLEDARALEEAIASVPRVRGIANRLSGPDIPETWRRVLQPGIGQVVFATDREVGRLDAVVIDPGSRRVAAIVVGGLPSDSPARERRVVISAAAVDRVTPSGVFLRLPGDRAAGYPDFEEDAYPRPPADWTPPFPYRRSDVRFPRTPRTGA